MCFLCPPVSFFLYPGKKNRCPDRATDTAVSLTSSNTFVDVRALRGEGVCLTGREPDLSSVLVCNGFITLPDSCQLFFRPNAPKTAFFKRCRNLFGAERGRREKLPTAARESALNGYSGRFSARRAEGRRRKCSAPRRQRRRARFVRFTCTGEGRAATLSLLPSAAAGAFGEMP